MKYAMDLAHRAFDAWLTCKQLTGTPPKVFYISSESERKLLEEGVDTFVCFGVPVEVSSDVVGDSIRAVNWGRIPKGILP